VPRGRYGVVLDFGGEARLRVDAGIRRRLVGGGLMAGVAEVRAAIPPAHPLARAEFATIRERLIKIAARVIEHVARIRIQLPTSCPEGALFRAVALGLMPSAPEPRGCVPRRAADEADQSPMRCTAS